MVLLIRCTNGVVAWRSRKLVNGTFVMQCFRDNFQIALDQSVNATWEAALAGVVTHSVGLAGAFQDMFVLPDRL